MEKPFLNLWQRHGSKLGTGMVGAPFFSRWFNDWELDEVEIFFRRLQSLTIKKEMEDILSREDAL